MHQAISRAYSFTARNPVVVEYTLYMPILLALMLLNVELMLGFIISIYVVAIFRMLLSEHPKLKNCAWLWP